LKYKYLNHNLSFCIIKIAPMIGSWYGKTLWY